MPGIRGNISFRRIAAQGRICAVVALLLAPPAAAFTEMCQLGAISATVYAPDWVWQKRDINILLIARNSTDHPVDLAMQLEFPEGQAEHFDYAGKKEKNVHVPARDMARASFAGIVARDRVPTQTYTFRICFSDGTNELALAYPVQTVRGAVVSGGNWALYLPVAITLLWCLVFAAALKKMAAPGAWRQPAPSIPHLAQIPAGTTDVPAASKDI